MTTFAAVGLTVLAVAAWVLAISGVKSFLQGDWTLIEFTLWLIVVAVAITSTTVALNLFAA